MPILPRRPGFTRWIAIAAIVLCSFVLIGFAVYHYVRRDRAVVDEGRMNELAKHTFTDPTSGPRDWPQWRGPNRDGVSTETAILREWPNGGPKVLWEAKTGEGFASVVVANGKAFTIFQDGPSETIVAWDAQTGREIWRFAYDCNYRNGYGNGPRSTPSVDGKYLYTVGGTGVVTCLDIDNFNGKPVWTTDLLKECNAPNLKWGVSFSPLVEGDRVFVMPGGPNGAGLAALDKTTGKFLWKKLDDPASYSSPVAATFHGRRQILFLTGERLVSVIPESGQELWSYPWTTMHQCNIATPIVMDNYVFISTGYGKGCALFKIEKSHDSWQAGLVYKNRNMKNHFSSCVRYMDHVYGFDDSNLVCLNLKTGERTWREHGFDKGSVLLAGDLLIVYGANGILALADANPEKYTERSRFQFSTQGSQCWSVPVLANGLLYVRDQEKLACLDVRTTK